MTISCIPSFITKYIFILAKLRSQPLNSNSCGKALLLSQVMKITIKLICVGNLFLHLHIFPSLKHLHMSNNNLKLKNPLKFNFGLLTKDYCNKLAL